MSVSDESSDAESFGPSDVHRIEAGGRRFTIVGTAHIARESVDVVREVIERERPDCVCLEIDTQQAGEFDNTATDSAHVAMKDVLFRVQSTGRVSVTMLVCFGPRALNQCIHAAPNELSSAGTGDFENQT